MTFQVQPHSYPAFLPGKKGTNGLVRLFPSSVESVKPPKGNRPFPQTSGYKDFAQTASQAGEKKCLGSANPAGCKTSSGFSEQGLPNVLRRLELPKTKIRVSRGFQGRPLEIPL